MYYYVAMTVKVTFHPQEWQENYGEEHAVPANDHESVSFTVPDSHATDDTGELPADDSYDSDLLHEHENAPEWVQDWSGPFYVTAEFVEE